MLALTAGLLLMSQLSLSSSYLTAVLPAILIASTGGSLSLTASNIAALSGAARGEEGIASGLINTSRQVGGPIGLAVAISVVGFITHGQGIVPNGSQVIEAFSYAFAVASGFAAVGVVASLLLRGRPWLRRPERATKRRYPDLVR